MLLSLLCASILLAVLCRIAWELYAGRPRDAVGGETIRVRRFRILHLGWEDGRWTRSAGHDVWYWDEPLFGRASKPS